MGAYIFLSSRKLAYFNLDNPTFRTLRYALPDLTQERRYRSSERGGEVGEEGGRQAVPQRRSCVLGTP